MKAEQIKRMKEMEKLLQRTVLHTRRPFLIEFVDQMKEIVKSCGFAVEGLGFAFRSQRNFRICCLVGMLATVSGLALHFSRVEMVLLILTVCLIIMGELLNTALELTLNLLEAQNHPVVRAAKDVAAGGVFLAVLGTVVIGLFLFGPKLLSLVGGS